MTIQAALAEPLPSLRMKAHLQTDSGALGKLPAAVGDNLSSTGASFQP